MRIHVSRRFHVSVSVMLSVSILLWAGCFLFPSSGFHNSLRINGYVLSSEDSSAVEGAEIIVYDETWSLMKDTEYSDSLGYFHCLWTPLTEEDVGDYREWVVYVHDVDGSENGVFADLDSIIIEDDPLHNSETEWNLTLYVEIL